MIDITTDTPDTLTEGPTRGARKGDVVVLVIGDELTRVLGGAAEVATLVELAVPGDVLIEDLRYGEREDEGWLIPTDSAPCLRRLLEREGMVAGVCDLRNAWRS